MYCLAYLVCNLVMSTYRLIVKLLGLGIFEWVTEKELLVLG